MGLAQKMAQASAGGGAAPGFPPAQQSYQQAPPPQQHQQPGGYSAPPSYDNYAQQAPQVPGGRPGSYQAPPQGGYAPPPGPPPQRTSSNASSFAPPSARPPPSNNPFSQPGGYGQPQGSPYGQPQGSHYGQPQGSPYGQPQQSQYGQQGQYGHQQPQQQPHQTAPQHAPIAGGASLGPQQVLAILEQCVTDQHIEAFYPPGSLQPLAQQVASSNALAQVCAEWKLPLEIGADLVKLALFDVVLLVDDSGSMAFEEEGSRIDDLALILQRAAYAASLFDSDGIQVRFLNSMVEGNGIRDAQGATALLSQIRYSGLTPLGTSMDRKVLEPLVLGPARAGRLQKPVLVIAITDGTPAGEPRDHIVNVILKANRELQRTRYGADAISFQFAIVGNDTKAQAFLSELDVHPVVGGLVDCISPFEAEQEEMMRKSQFTLTPDLYLLKLLMGGIDSSYDEQDE